MNSSSTTEGAASAEHSAGLALRFGISVGVVSLVIILIIASYLCNYKRLQLQPLAAAADNTQHSDDDNDDVELGPAIIDFPRTRFSELPAKLGDCNNCCAICLGEYNDDDFVRQLPDCHHMFHVDCIARWLGLHGTCPLCRTSAVTAPPHRFNFLIPFSRYTAT